MLCWADFIIQGAGCLQTSICVYYQGYKAEWQTEEPYYWAIFVPFNILRREWGCAGCKHGGVPCAGCKGGSILSFSLVSSFISISSPLPGSLPSTQKCTGSSVESWAPFPFPSEVFKTVVHQETLSQPDGCWAQSSAFVTVSKSLAWWKTELAGGLGALKKSVQNPIKSLVLLSLTNESIKGGSSKSNLRSLKDAVPVPDLSSLANELRMERRAERRAEPDQLARTANETVRSHPWFTNQSPFKVREPQVPSAGILQKGSSLL